ncbi:hypothetical protein Lser_V15G27492 [Lactuca serriola]
MIQREIVVDLVENPALQLRSKLKPKRHLLRWSIYMVQQ